MGVSWTTCTYQGELKEGAAEEALFRYGRAESV